MTSDTAISNHGIDIMDRCPECGCSRIETDYTKGERVCSQCGCVLEDNFIDLRPEPSYEGKDREHTGAPKSNLLHDGGLSTTISRSWRDGRGNYIDCKTRSRFNRLNRIHQYTRMNNAFEKGLAAAYTEIKKLSSSLSLPEKIVDGTAILYKKAMKADLIRGRSMHMIVSACIYISCRVNGVPRTLKEISKVSKISSTDLGRAYNFVSNSLKINRTFMKPAELVPRFCTQLNLSPSAQAKALEIIEIFERSGKDSGKSPTGIAAAAIYISTMICNERRTQKKVAEVTNITEVTIRNRTEEMLSLINAS